MLQRVRYDTITTAVDLGEMSSTAFVLSSRIKLRCDIQHGHAMQHIRGDERRVYGISIGKSESNR
jgi:hypothetical protein